jgi:hypothetical protein
MSPFEHVAHPDPVIVRDENDLPCFPSNFRGWFQLRKSFQHESDFGKALSDREASS